MAFYNHILERHESDFSQNSLPFEKEDFISLYAFIGQLPRDVSYYYGDIIDCASKVVAHILPNLFGASKLEKLSEIIKTTAEEKQQHYRQITIDNHNLYLRNTFVFQVITISSLKHAKTLLLEDIKDLQILLKRAADCVRIDEILSLHILKTMEMILKKRPDCLSPDLSVSLLKAMNLFASAPLEGFKHYSHRISKVVFRSLPLETVNSIISPTSYYSLMRKCPLGGVDLSDVLNKYVIKGELANKEFIENINIHILMLFRDNTESRNGSFYYDALVSNFTFEEFQQNIWPLYYNYLQKSEEGARGGTGDFSQSLIKYWIPINVRHYKADFYYFLRDKNVELLLKSHALLEIKRNDYYDKAGLDSDTLMFLRLDRTSLLGLRILCKFPKKSILPDQFDINALKSFIESYAGGQHEKRFSEEVYKALAAFFSQVFVVSNISVANSRTENLTLYIEFLRFIFTFCIANINKKEFCDTSAQLLLLVWKLSESSSSLVTDYKVNRENRYDFGQNLFYKYLQKSGFWRKTFLSDQLLEVIEGFVDRDYYVSCPYLTELLTNYYIPHMSTSIARMEFRELLTGLEDFVFLQSSEILRSRTKLIMHSKIQKHISYGQELDDLYSIFRHKLKKDQASPKDIFYCVLVLDLINEIKMFDDGLDLVPVLEESLAFIEQFFDEDSAPTTALMSNPKSSKVLESLINNTIEGLIKSRDSWWRFDKNRLLRQLSVIIQKSNLKRPVSVTAGLLKHLGNFMDATDHDDESKTLKIKFFDATLRSLYYSRSRLNVKIRKNPDTRLVIHALLSSSASTNLQWMYIDWAFKFMLKILSDAGSSDAVLTSTMNCVEVLITDNSIYHLTLKFIPEIMRHCLRLFNKPTWSVRNSNLQLSKSLIERFLGASVGEEGAPSQRPKTIEDLFLLFPHLIDEYIAVFSAQPCLNDSAILAFLFFSESNLLLSTSSLSKSVINNNFSNKLLFKFKFLFARIIETHSDIHGALAVKSFASLTSLDEIPDEFCRTVAYIMANFRVIKKNTLSNLIHLLEELYIKYNRCSPPELNNSNTRIRRSYSDLIVYLKKHDHFDFNFYSLKLHSVLDVSEMICFSDIDYKKRIWLNNYIPLVIREVNHQRLNELLEEILILEIPDFLQANILSVIVDRFVHDTTISTSGTDNNFLRTMVILIYSLFRLNDHNTYLLSSYSKTILLLFDGNNKLCFTSSSDLVLMVKNNFLRGNQREIPVHKMIIYALILSHCPTYDPEMDETFLNRDMIRNCVVNSALRDDLIAYDISLSYVHLYKITRSSDRVILLKLALYLLMNVSTGLEMCRFVVHLTGRQCFTVLDSLEHFLKSSNLLKCLGDDALVAKFLQDCYVYVVDNLLNEDSSNDGDDTYYMVESKFSLSPRHVERLLYTSICKFENVLK